MGGGNTAPLAIDLCCGLGGWTEGLLAEGWRVRGYDIEQDREDTARAEFAHRPCLQAPPASRRMTTAKLSEAQVQQRSVSIVVYGPPVPKGRPRLSTINGHARAFTPAKTRRCEDLIRHEAGLVMEGRDQLQGQTQVHIRAFMPMPQALAKHKTNGPLAEAGTIRPVTKPDADNLCKVIDALNGIVWPDDNQVVSLTVDKFYSARPRLELTAGEL